MNHKRDALLRRMLRRPETPPGLKHQLKANLHVQVRAERPATHRRALATAALIVLGLTGVFWMGDDDGIPTLVGAAREHAAEESGLREIEQRDLQPWLQAVGASAPQSDKLVLFKTCVVDGLEVKHLRVRLDTGGTVDLMVDATGQWRTRTAPGADHGWQIAHPQRNVSLIMFHAPHHASEAARLLEALFPAAHSLTYPKTEV